MDTVTNEVIPFEVLAIIAAEEKRRADEKAEQELQVEIKRQEYIERGRALFDEWTIKRKEYLPPWALEYVSVSCDEEALEHAGKYDRRDDGIEAYFGLLIPGLAPIKMVLTNSSGQKIAEFIVPSQRRDEFNDEKPRYFWGGNWSTETLSLNYALLVAKQEAEKLEAAVANYDNFQKEQEARNAERSQREEERNKQLAEQKSQTAQAEKDEVEKLLTVLHSDPVAMNLIKAFIAIRQERSIYEEQISQTNDALYSMEERWSRRTSELRRQAEDADRRAAEEHSRADDLQDDLARVKKKNK